MFEIDYGGLEGQLGISEELWQKKGVVDGGTWVIKALGSGG
jgi:hypothetical protein